MPMGMADFFFIGLLACLGGIVFSVWRACALFDGWLPSAATVWRSDYTENQQSEDLWCAGMTAFTSRGYNWRDGEDMRLIEDEIRFYTAEGLEVRAVVERRVHRGFRPAGVYTVWYKVADPHCVTANGPWAWIFYAVLFAVACGVLGAQLARMGLPPALHGLF